MKEKYYAVQVQRTTKLEEELVRTIVVLASCPREAVKKTERFNLYNQIEWPPHYNYKDNPPLVFLQAEEVRLKTEEICE